MGKSKQLLLKELTDYIFEFNKIQHPRSEKLTYTISDKNIVLKCYNYELIFTLLTVDNSVSGIDEIMKCLKDGNLI